MLRERVVVALLVLPPVIWLITVGGWPYVIMVALVASIAVAELGLLFRSQGLRPSLAIMVGGALAFSVTIGTSGFANVPVVLAGLCLAGIVWHLADYERGAPKSGTDFAVTLSGTLYVGWLASYLVSLRRIPDGEWWVLLALPTTWLSDSAAYFVGRAFGRHKMAPRLSPKKTWEGYLAGVLGGALGGGTLGLALGLVAGASSLVTGAHGAVLGTAIGLLSPLGDLGISMIKREVAVKDTGNLIPGHGGALDRIDSLLWAGVLAFYLATLLAR
ncbi:MAG TPA: phosphatidate cytidylyltransferase [Anaerolineales bacterium]|jgi:phosphatidate cytidylyltransferase|nr:phosphatidate cytidylyltransferase [Anaerolineales bacterium]